MFRNKGRTGLCTMLSFFQMVVACWALIIAPVNTFKDYEHVARMLQDFGAEYEAMTWLMQTADWSASTNITTATTSARSYTIGANTEWMQDWKLWARSSNIISFPTSIAKTVSVIASGIVFADPDDARKLSDIRSEMTKIYNSVNITLPEENITIHGEDEAKSIMHETKDPLVLKKVWKSWRTEVGNKMEPLYLRLVDIANKAARQNGYADVGVVWRSELGLLDVVSTAMQLWDEVKDFYKEIHAFARFKLQQLYGKQNVPEEEPIAVHLLGSLWGESWEALFDLMKPYNNVELPDITMALKAKQFTVRDIIEIAEKFYTSMGLSSMSKSFWDKSLFVKPDDRIVDCHSAAYDFYRHQDYRVRMCCDVHEECLKEAVHEMGHVEYYMAYAFQPMIYRNGANSAFHEAVAETMAFAAQHPKCLNFLGLIDAPSNESTDLTLNLLMKQALSRFVFLPWALTVDLWRYNLFSGDIEASTMTSKWWQLRKEFQGVRPPDIDLDFDAGSKYHVISNMPYMRYYLGRFLEHQFYDALCAAAGQDLHSCCLAQSRVAGDLLSRMMSLGSSTSWENALEVLTGQRHLSTKPMMKYYAPLYEWLITYNRKHNVTLSW